MKLVSKVNTWSIGENERLFVNFTIPFKSAAQFFVAKPFNALTGQGSQRVNFDSQVKNLRRAIQNGNFTPTSFNVSAVGAKFSVKNNEITIEFDDKNPLELINGDHRMSALKQLLAQAEDKNETELIDQINNLPIPTLLYLDGDPKIDFVNLQLGRSIDASHMFSMKVRSKLLPEKRQVYADRAWKIAQLLDDSKDCPFYHQIKFDSRRMSGLPIASLCSQSSSEIGASLVGLARVAGAFNKDEAWASDILIKTLKAVENANLPATDDDGFLAFPPEGTKGSATMLAGVATLAAFYVLNNETDDLSKTDAAIIVESIRDAIVDKVNGNFSSNVKRELLRKLAVELFSNVECEKHCDIPVKLIKILSAATFALPAVPKETKEDEVVTVEGVSEEKEEVTTKEEITNEEELLNDVVGELIES